MSTLSQGDTTVDISDEILETINVAPIVLDGVDEEFTDATEIELTSTDGTALRTETSGSTVLTGESLEGTAEEPASISLVTDGSKEAQLVAVNTASIANTVITTAESVDGSSVAAAQVVISSETVEAVSIKTASTEQKSQVRFDQTTESLAGVRIEMEGAGGNLDVQSSTVDRLEVKAAGTEFSEITFGSEVDSVSNAAIEIGEAGGSIALESGELSESTIAIDSDPDAVNAVTIGSNVSSVADTTLQLTKGSTSVEIGSKEVENVEVVTSSKQGSTLNVNSEVISGFVLSVEKSDSDLSLQSESTIEDTTINSSAKKNGSVDVDIESKSNNTSITNSKKGTVDATFAQRTENLNVQNTNKGTIELNFAKKVVSGELAAGKGAIDASFTGKVVDIKVNASDSKNDIILDFNKSLKGGELNLGRGADVVIFNGAIKDDSTTLDLGNDGKSDFVAFTSPNKVNAPITISNFGGKDILEFGEFPDIDRYTGLELKALSQSELTDILGPNIAVEFK